MAKNEKLIYKVALRQAKNSYKKEKASAKYAYKLEKGRLKFSLRQEISADHPEPSARRKAETKAAIRRAKQDYKSRKAEEKLGYLRQKNEAKLLYTKHKKWASDSKTPASLSFSLAAAFVLVFLGIMILQGVFVLWTVSYMTNRQCDAQLSTVFSTLEAADFSETAARSASNGEISFVSLIKGGKTVYQAGDSRLAESAYGKEAGIHKITVGTTNYRLLCQSTQKGTVYIAKSMMIEDNVFALLLVVMSVATVLAAIASGVVGISVSQSCLRPIHSMSRLMKEMTVNDLSARLDTNKIHTELREVARHYNQMMDRLQASYEAQARFVSDASHELRTPLAVISGYADILERWGKEEPQVLEEAIGAISTQSRLMNELLERLLTVSKMENALPEPSLKEQELYPLLEEVTRDFALVAGDRDIVLQADKTTSFAFDADLLRQTLVIFLDNAVKFTEVHGQITVFSKEDEQSVTVGVRDDGIGIDEDKLDKIFDRFYKVDAARGEKGYGLGLSIAARLSAVMGSEIVVDSVAGQGATFALRFTKPKA